MKPGNSLADIIGVVRVTRNTGDIEPAANVPLALVSVRRKTLPRVTAIVQRLGMAQLPEHHSHTLWPGESNGPELHVGFPLWIKNASRSKTISSWVPPEARM